MNWGTLAYVGSESNELSSHGWRCNRRRDTSVFARRQRQRRSGPAFARLAGRRSAGTLDTLF